MATNAKSVTELYQALRPLILRDMGATVSAADGPALEAHALAGPYHTGTILESQAPWAASKAEWAAALASHVALPNVHHAQSHVLATNAGLGSDHTINGATAGHVLRASSATAAAFAAIQDTDLPSTIVRTSRTLTAGAGLIGTSTLASDVTFVVGAGAGITVNADDVALTTPGSITATSTNSSSGSHTHSIDSTIARSAITLTAGNGFAAGSGGDLTANRTFTLGTPGALSATTTDAVTTNSHTHSIATAAATTLTVATTNAAGSSASLARADHTHSIATSSNPGAAVSILASNVSGYLQLTRLGIGVAPVAAIGLAASTAANGGIDFGGDVNLYRSAANVLKTDDTFNASGGLQKNSIDVIAYDDLVQFAEPWQSKRIVMPELFNVLHRADARFTVSQTGFATFSANTLFYNLENISNKINAGGTGVITIDFTGKSEYSAEWGVVYPQGYIYIHCYKSGSPYNQPQTVSGRFLDKNGVWWNMTSPTWIASNIWRLTVPGNNYLITMELSIVALPDDSTFIWSIEYYPFRQNGLFMTFPNKFQAERIYSDWTWRDSSNVEKAKIAATTGAISGMSMTANDLASSRLVASDANKKLTSVSDLTAWIGGTANRVTVANDGDGTITLSAPQDIHTTATPTFGGLIAPWLRPAADSTTALQLRNMAGAAVMTVDTLNKRVGIGTTPSYKFQAQTDTNGYVAVFNSTGSGDNHGLYISVNDLSGTPMDNFVILHSSGSSGGGFVFASGNTERFRMTTDGKFGVGMDPTYQIDVSGSVRLSGTLYADGGIVDFGTNYFQESTDFELRGAKALSLFQTIKAASWNITTTGAATLTDVIAPSVRAGSGVALTLGAGTDIILNPTSTLVRASSGVSLQASSYASQTTGWRVTDAGEADFRYLFVDEMHAKSFIADLEQALAGGQIIAKSVAVVAAAFTLPTTGNTGTLRVRDLPSAPNMAVFQSGDFVGLRQFSRSAGSLTIGWAWGTVTSYADGTGGNEGTQTWTFTRSATPGSASGTIVADALVLDFGVSGNGFYEVNAIDGAYGQNSPYAQVVTWATHPATQTVRARFGNLRGIPGLSVDEFGLYAGSGTGLTDRYIRASSSAVELHNVPLALYDGANNTMLLSAGASNNAPFLAMGSPLPTGPLVENGIWAGKDGTDYELRVGTVSAGVLTKGLHWDGANLVWKATNTSLDASGNLTATNATLSGQITATTGAIGGWTIQSYGLIKDSGADATSAGMAPGDYPFYAGKQYASRASAPFRVTNAGVLTATSGTVGGWTIASNLTGGNVLLDPAGKIRVGAASADRLWIDATDATYRLWAGNDTAASAPFRVQKSGAFHFGSATRYLSFDGTDIAWAGVNTSLTAAGAFSATNATIAGVITANTGYIGGALGWTIATGAITSNNIGLYSGAANSVARIEVGTGTTYAGINSASDAAHIAFWAGDTYANRAIAEFRVTAGGALYASSANITGTIDAADGYLGNMTVDGTLLVSTGGVLRSGMTGYATGTGWYMDFNNGGSPRLSIGTGSAGTLTNGLAWNGSSLSIVGNAIIGPGTGFVTTAKAHWKFDAPQTNRYRANLNSHLGAYPTALTGTYRGDDGKFGGGLQLRPNSTNYINNSSFEVNTTDYWSWYNSPTVTRVDGGYSGDYCASMTTATVGNPYMYRGNLVGGPAHSIGQVWVFSAYVKAGNAGAVGKTVTARIREDSNDTYISSATLTVTADWQRISVTHTLATAATNLNHYLIFTSSANSGDVLLIDAVQMELTQLTGYVDGSMEGAAWGGTAHNSISTQASHSALAYDKSVLPATPTEGTAMLWVKPTAAVAGQSYNNYLRYNGSSGYIIIRADTGSANWQAYWGNTPRSGGSLTYGSWQHVAVTRLAGTTTLYVNGVAQGTAAGTELAFHASNGLVLGQSSEPCNGVVDEVAILDRALTADEIAQVYRSGQPLTVPASTNELAVSGGGMSAVRINALGITALDSVGGESFALANGALTWGSRYSGGSALASGDLVLGDPDQFHLIYDASAASLTIGKPTEEHIVIDSSGIKIKNNTTAYLTLDGGNASFTGAITAQSGSIAGALTIGVGGSITAGNIVIENAGISATVSTSWDANIGYKLKSGAGIYGGLYGYSSTVANYATLINNRVITVGAPLENKDSYVTVETYATTTKIAAGLLSASTVDGYGAISKSAKIMVTASQATSSHVAIEADSLTFNGNAVWYAGNDGAASGLDADTLDTYHASSFSLATHTHSYADITGIGNISTTGSINTGSAYQRSGTAGYIFVPSWVAALTDSSGVVGSASRNAGTYTFDMSISANGSLPTNAKAAVISIEASWTASGNTLTLNPRGDTSKPCAVLRGQAAYVLNTITAVVLLDSNGDFEMVLANGVVSGSLTCRMIGYFV